MKSYLSSRFLPCLFLILGAVGYLEADNTFFKQLHEFQNAFRVRRETPSSSNSTSCELPDHPDFGSLKIIGNAEGSTQQIVEKNTIVEFGCNDGYKLSSELKHLICMEDGWTPRDPPKCLQKCPALYSNEQTNIECEKNGVQIGCDEATEGTSASYQCAPYFEPEERTKLNRFCFSGKWNKPTPNCQPVCGEKRVSATPLIVNGLKVEKGVKYPWAAAIFHVYENGEIKNICGGSILTQTIIITAAHCVTDDSAKLLPKEKILVGVGKYYNKYKDPRDTQAQYSSISKVIVHERYRGDTQRYANDIALLVTQDRLLLSQVVQPVCYGDLPDHLPNIGDIGVVAGWGFSRTESKPSDELTVETVPYTPDSVCLQELPTDFADKYFTNDKMCAGSKNDAAKCTVGSGVGLAIADRDGHFYLHGIASVGVRNHNNSDCDSLSNVLYTKVAYHYDWLERHILQ